MTRSQLGSFLRHCLEQGIPLEGASDHLVSQALYLRDPEGNGIEVYADRPRESWQWKNDRINMATLRIDTSALLKLAGPFSGFPAQTCLGHMHLIEIIRPPLQPGTFQDPDDITVVVSPPA